MEKNQNHKNIKVILGLSGGVDSAILAAYLKPGSNAYTFTTNLSSSFNLLFLFLNVWVLIPSTMDW